MPENISCEWAAKRKIENWLFLDDQNKRAVMIFTFLHFIFWKEIGEWKTKQKHFHTYAAR